MTFTDFIIKFIITKNRYNITKNREAKKPLRLLSQNHNIFKSK